MMTKVSVSLLAAAFALAAVPALAADLPRGVVAAPPPAPAPQNTISFEASPEFVANSANTNYGSLADWYGKLGYSHSFGNGLSGSLSFQDTFKIPTTAFPAGSTQQYYEGALAYKLAVAPNFSFTVTGTLGYTAGNTGYQNDLPVGSGTEGFLYYAISGAADWKIDKHWTWNVINARYRNAFNLTWITPKVTTGLTYTIDQNNAVYANIGYSWKDNGNGQGLLADKLNVAVGYKYSF